MRRGAGHCQRVFHLYRYHSALVIRIAAVVAAGCHRVAVDTRSCRVARDGVLARAVAAHAQACGQCRGNAQRGIAVCHRDGRDARAQTNRLGLVAYRQGHRVFRRQLQLRDAVAETAASHDRVIVRACRCQVLAAEAVGLSLADGPVDRRAGVVAHMQRHRHHTVTTMDCVECRRLRALGHEHHAVPCVGQLVDAYRLRVLHRIRRVHRYHGHMDAVASALVACLRRVVVSASNIGLRGVSVGGGAADQCTVLVPLVAGCAMAATDGDGEVSHA